MCDSPSKVCNFRNPILSACNPRWSRLNRGPDVSRRRDSSVLRKVKQKVLKFFPELTSYESPIAAHHRGQQIPKGNGRRQVNLDGETLHRLGGITGIGWTTSILGYASTVIGYGSEYLARIVTNPQSFLYAGGVLFFATLGLDKLAQRLDVDSSSPD